MSEPAQAGEEGAGQGIRTFRLRRLPPAARATITGFVLAAACGYLVALLNLYLTYADADGRPGLTAADLERRLAASRTETVLSRAIDGGRMEAYLRSSGEKVGLLRWARSGAPASGYAAVQPILARNCVRCHNPSGAASFRPLNTFDQVSAVTKRADGESIAAWARVAHVHLQSLALLYLALGMLFALSGIREWVKMVVVSLPFIALIVDFAARALAPRWPSMVHVMLASGALLGVATGMMMLGVLWEVWGGGRLSTRRRAHPESGGREADQGPP